MSPETRTKPQVAIMNAVHDLPVLVARDMGFFRDEGLDLEFVTTPRMAQVTTTQEHDRARRDLREHRRQPGLGVARH